MPISSELSSPPPLSESEIRTAQLSPSRISVKEYSVKKKTKLAHLISEADPLAIHTDEVEPPENINIKTEILRQTPNRSNQTPRPRKLQEFKVNIEAPSEFDPIGVDHQKRSTRDLRVESNDQTEDGTGNSTREDESHSSEDYDSEDDSMGDDEDGDGESEAMEKSEDISARPGYAVQYSPSKQLSADERCSENFDSDQGSSEFDNSEPDEDDDEHDLNQLSPQSRQILRNEIADLRNSLDDKLRNYKVTDRLGEGTFSSVYKAIDLAHSKCDNSGWTPETTPTDNRVYVALKRIYVTSASERIENEIEIMAKLRGHENVSYLVTALRHKDQVVAVMPFHQNDDFRYYYKADSPAILKSYFKSLFKGLRSCHSLGVIHRDIKPANFLFDLYTGKGWLCDFGLAQMVEPTTNRCNHTSGHETLNSQPHGITASATSRNVQRAKLAVAKARKAVQEHRVGFSQDDKRQHVRANRAGTRGFRAPEVLLKCQDQSVSLDIWSAGIILLSFLTFRFPFFTSSDDTEALMEIAAIFGKDAMESCAILHSEQISSAFYSMLITVKDRTFATNVPHLSTPRDDPLRGLIRKIRPDFFRASRISPSAQVPVKLETGARSMGPPSIPVDQTPKDDSWTTPEVEAVLELLYGTLHLDCTRRWTAKEALECKFLKD